MTSANDAPAPALTRLPTAAALASELRVGVMRLARRLRFERGSAIVTDSQLSVLGTLERHGPRTPRELADHERVQPPSMTRTLAALEDLGLVSRTPHPSDRRQVLVALAPRGRDEIREIRRRRDEWLAPRLAALSAQDRRTLHEAAQVLSRLAQS